MTMPPRKKLTSGSAEPTTGDTPPPIFDSAATIAAVEREAESYVARARTMMGRTRLLVQADRSDAGDLLSLQRSRLGNHLKRYQAFKHGTIFDPVVRYGPASSKVVARTMKIDCMELGEMFASYHSCWLGLQASEWPRYRRDTLSIFDNLTSHIEAELRAMRQLITISRFRHS